MYLNGQGTAANAALAYGWAATAAESGDRRSLKLRDRIAELFSPQQLEVARRVAAELRRQYGMDAMDIVCKRERPPNKATAITRTRCIRAHHRESKYLTGIGSRRGRQEARQ